MFLPCYIHPGVNCQTDHGTMGCISHCFIWAPGYKWHLPYSSPFVHIFILVTVMKYCVFYIVYLSKFFWSNTFCCSLITLCIFCCVGLCVTMYLTGILGYVPLTWSCKYSLTYCSKYGPFPQVLAVCLHPELLGNKTLPLDVRLRAQRLLEVCDGGSVGKE